MIAQVIDKLLIGASAITAVVGDRISYAMRPGVPISFDPPALVIQRVSHLGRPTLKGPGSVAYGQIRVACLASSYLAAGDLAELVRQALDGYAGNVTIVDSAGNTQTIRVGYLKLDGMTDLPSDQRDGQGEITTHGVEIDFNYQLHRQS